MELRRPSEKKRAQESHQLATLFCRAMAIQRIRLHPCFVRGIRCDGMEVELCAWPSHHDHALKPPR